MRVRVVNGELVTSIQAVQPLLAFSSFLYWDGCPWFIHRNIILILIHKRQTGYEHVDWIHLAQDMDTGYMVICFQK